MHIPQLEHVNITVSDPKATAAMLCQLFGWHIRWEGASMDNGYTVHVGSEQSYIAVYANEHVGDLQKRSHNIRGGLNHIAIVVEDLDAIERRVKKAGFVTNNHGDYEPGRRFYFRDNDQVEYEIVSYVAQSTAFRRQVTRQMGEMARNGALTR